MSDKIVLDTHVLIWSLVSPENIAEHIKEQISTARDSDNLYISSITLWEIAMLVVKKRIDIFERTADFLNSIVDKGLNVIQINPNIATESVMLPGGFKGDPADCIIIASTREIVGTLITRDRKIINWATQGYLKVAIA